MYHYRNHKSEKKWQKTFINNVFKHKTKTISTFSQIILSNTTLLGGKGDILPKSLYKFYAPTSDNMFDIRKQRLWLSHPTSFNDPFDCQTGYDINSCEKHELLNHFKETGCVNQENIKHGFTVDEFQQLMNAPTSYDNHHSKIYDSVLRKLLENKSDDFQRNIRKLTQKARDDVKIKIDSLRSVNIRVACFSALDKYDDFDSVIQMWAHYADNHKGFCIEYDTPTINEQLHFSLKEYEFHKDQSRYMDERVKVLIYAGLFPVIYTSRRINIPKTKLNRMQLDRTKGLQHNSDIDSILYKTYIVKSPKWSYEKEWRIILDGDVCSFYDNMIPFPNIKCIYLGCRMNAKSIETMIEIAKELGVEVYRMVMDNNKFLLEDRSLRMYQRDKDWARQNPFYDIRN